VLSCYLTLSIPTKKQRDALELEEAWLRTLGEDSPLEVF